MTNFFGKGVRDPLKIFQDGMEGKLHNSLAMAVINDLRDLIKALRAQKRDVMKEVFTSTIQNTGKNRDIIDTEVQTSENITQAISYVGIQEPLFEEMVEGLDDDEKKVLTLIYKENNAENIIAVQLHKSPSWVTKIKKKAIYKLRQERSKNVKDVML